MRHDQCGSVYALGGLNGDDHLAHWAGALAAAASFGRQERAQDDPLGIGQVASIALPGAAMLPPGSRGSTSAARKRAPAALAGLLEVRGLGIARLPSVTARLRLEVRLGEAARLPTPSRDGALDLPVVTIDPFAASACARGLGKLDESRSARPPICHIIIPYPF